MGQILEINNFFLEKSFSESFGYARYLFERNSTFKDAVYSDIEIYCEVGSSVMLCKK
jgi:hypothetical protein